jgi:ER-bound oxygenase mpaB/B'/Rubber oxygenase, catalytic domain
MTERWTKASLREQEKVGDPEADAVIAALVKEDGVVAASRLLGTLTQNDQLVPENLPLAIRGYIEEARQLPDWADPERMRNGSRVFELWGRQIGLCLWCSALAEGYMDWRLSHVVHLTGRMDSDLKRRALETFQFLLDVMEPDGLDPGGDGKGISSALRVRLTHASIRVLTLGRATDSDDGDPAQQIWDSDWGVPISQVDLLGTLMGFSVLTLSSLEKLGVSLAAEEREDYFHNWMVVGHFMGIEASLLPADLAEGQALVELGRELYYRPSDVGIALEEALRTTLEDMLPFTLRHLPRQMMRGLIGDEYADALQIPRAPAWRNRVFLAAAWMQRRLLRKLSKTGLPDFAVPFSRAFMRAYLRHERGGERPPFAIPTSLRATFDEEK